MPPKSQRPLPSVPIIHIAARFYARRRKTIHERFFGTQRYITGGKKFCQIENQANKCAAARRVVASPGPSLLAAGCDPHLKVWSLSGEKRTLDKPRSTSPI